MPIYEYRCRQCRKKFEHIHIGSVSAETVCCPHCQSRELERLISRVRVMKSEESRLESLADPSKLSGFDEDDPQSVARWMRKMGKEMGKTWETTSSRWWRKRWRRGKIQGAGRASS